MLSGNCKSSSVTKVFDMRFYAFDVTVINYSLSEIDKNYGDMLSYKKLAIHATNFILSEINTSNSSN